jgi:hypothetical protein
MLSVAGIAAWTLLAGYREGQQPMRGTKLCKIAECSSSSFLLSFSKVRELETAGFLVIDNALNPLQLQCAYSEAKILQETLEDSPNKSSVTRTDIVRFMTQVDRDNAVSSGVETASKEKAGIAGNGLLYAQNVLRGMGMALVTNNFAGFNGCKFDEGMYLEKLSVPDQVQLSMYKKDGGGFYTAHRDGVSNSFQELGLLQWMKLACYRARVVTAILYLNDSTPPWEETANGGMLRLYIGANSKDDIGTTAVSVHDIAPVGGRLVLFDSQKVLHEVLATNRDRYAITVWFTIV